jgi:DNA-binding transcriptional LysR family regulator
VPLTQPEIDALTAAIAARTARTAADDAAAANRLPNLLAQFATNHPGLVLTGLQAEVTGLTPNACFWAEQKLRQLAAS